MQISRDDDEQSAHLKTSFETSERKIDQQIEYFNDLNRIHLKNEHRRFSSHLSDYRTVSIHLLCFDLIRSQRRTRFQAEEKCRINLYKKRSNSNDSNYFKRLQKHRRRSSENWIVIVFHTSTTEHDHLWRVITSDHQFDISLHQESQSATQSISRSQSNAASAHALCTAKLSTKAENQICRNLQ
jgi:hypothetical protein